MTTPTSGSIANPGNFLRTSRNFPLDPQALSVELSRTYVDIANEVNNRISGIFGQSSKTITGESWFLGGSASRQQTLRQVYTFTSTASIPHGIDTTQISNFTRLFGTYTDGTNTYGLLAGSTTAIAGQISFYISPTSIVFVVGAGAPSVTSGIVVLEWLSNV